MRHLSAADCSSDKPRSPLPASFLDPPLSQMSVGKRIRRWKNEFKDWAGLSSPGQSTTSLPDMRQPSPSPVPQTLQRSVTPLPNTTSSSAQIDSGSQLLSPPNGPVPSQPIASMAASGPPSPVPDSQPSLHVPPASPDPSQTMHSNEETKMKLMAWSGLKVLLKVLDASGDVFPPLKSAVGGLNQCIDIFEVCLYA